MRPPSPLFGLSLAVSCAGVALAQTRPPLSDTTRAYVAVDGPLVAITHALLIDGSGGPPRPDQTIVINGAKIEAVGPSASIKVPSGAQIIDATGRTVIPGMVGMHNHTFYTNSAGRRNQLNTSAPRLYLAAGLTTIRTTGSISPYAEISLKQQIDRGDVPGPRMYISGPYITGPDQVVERKHITTPEEARRVIDYWADEGATWFKVYTEISRANLKAVTEAAHRRGLKVTGHLCSVGYREAVEAGIDGLEHGLMANLEYHPAKQPDQCPGRDLASYATLDVNSEAVQSTFRALVRAKVPMTSTLAVYEISLPNRPDLQQRVLDAMTPDVRSEYLATRERLAAEGGASSALAAFKKAMEYERAFVKAGGILAAGVDPTGNGGALPGFGDQRNYELLREAGFSASEAVQIMTANGAAVLGALDVGTVASGKSADLVILRGDLAADPRAIRGVETVFKDGIGYDSAKLIASVNGLVGIR